MSRTGTSPARPSPRERLAKACRHPDLLFLLALAAVWGLFFWPEILGWRYLYLKDIPYLYYPLKQFVATCLHRGELPFWNPFVGCGEPALANPQYLLFYPTYFPYYLSPSLYLFQFHFLIQFLLAATGFYLLLRRHLQNRPAAFAGSVIYGFNGFALSHVYFQNLAAYLALLPWLLLALGRLLDRPTPRRMALLAVPAALAGLAAEPYYLLFLAGAAAAYAVWPGRQALPSLRRAWPRLLGAAALAFLAASVQLLPAAFTFLNSTRIAWSFEDKYPLRLPDLVNVVIGGFYGRMGDPAALDPVVRGEAAPRFYLSFYLGAIPILLAAAGWARYRWPRRLVLLGVAAGSLWLALGEPGWLYRWCWENVPLIGTGRFAAKLFFPVMVVAAGLAALGFDRLTGAAATRPHLGKPALTALAVTVAAGAVFHLRWGAGILNQAGGWQGAALTLLLPVGAALAAQVVLALWVWGVSAWGRRRPGATWPAAVLAGLVLVSLRMEPGVLYEVEPRFFQPVPSYTALTGPGEPVCPWRVAPDPRCPPVAHADPYRSYAFAQELAAPFTNSLHRFPAGLSPFSSGLNFRYKDYAAGSLARPGLEPADFTPFLAATSVRWLVAPWPLHGAELESLGPSRRPGLPPVWRYRLRQAVPMVHFPRRIHSAAPGEAVRRLFRPGSPPGEDCWLEGPVGRLAGATARCTEIMLELNRCRFRVRASGPAFAVFNQTRDPGWRATVDGRPAEIRRVNGFFQGVAVPAGEHKVEFRYLPEGFAAGLLLTLAGAVCWAVAFRRSTGIDSRDGRA